MQRIFYPKDIVVIGVSEQPDNLARNILGNLRAFGYQGGLYAVGRRPGTVHDVPIQTSLEEVPDGVDLAVILTPAFLVPGFMETCGRKGILRVVIESGGFGEFSEQGRELEDQLLEIASKYGIRFVGPNCISAVNLEAGLCLPFAPLDPADLRLGPASVIAQSGGISISYMHRLGLAGVGANKGVSIGNKTDLGETDYLQYLLEDPGTRMVFLYLESVADGRRLMDLALSSTKPVVIHKANRGKASQAVAFSHTAALANDDRVISAAFRQAGILRAESFRDSIAIGQGLSLPPVRGNDLIVISRSGGHAVVAADVAEGLGFRLCPLPEAFAEAVRSLFRADVIAPNNPLDLGTVFDFDLYAQIVERSLQALSPDAVLLINTYGREEAEGARRLAHRVQEIVESTQRPVAFCAYSRAKERERLQEELRMPLFTELEEALRGLAASRDRARWLERRDRGGPQREERPEPRPAGLPDAPGILTPDRALALCETYRIPVTPFRMAADASGITAAAEAIGFPVALKAVSADLVHKTDVGAVALDLGDSRDVRTALTDMQVRLGGVPGGREPIRWMVQPMRRGAVEIILGGKRDPGFGPVVMFGLGGIHAEVYQDVSFRVAPIRRADAEEMLEEVRGHALLSGHRGGVKVSREALVTAMLNLSRMLTDNPGLAEIDINPLLGFEDRVEAADARARFE